MIVELVDELLDDHIYDEIADLLNERGLRPGGSARPGREHARFTAKRVAYLSKTYGLRPRFDRLRLRGMLTRKELADRLGIHEATVEAWAKHGIVKARAYNAHAFLFEDPGPNPPEKHSNRWNPLATRTGSEQTVMMQSQLTGLESKEM